MAKEKEFTRLREDLARERRALPWERVDKAYVFEAPEGRVTLADLFDGRSLVTTATEFSTGGDHV